jgi:hypothetical protein
MTDQDRRKHLAEMLEQAQLLEREDDPVLAINMARVAAILHETRQLIDPDYMALQP